MTAGPLLFPCKPFPFRDFSILSETPSCPNTPPLFQPLIGGQAWRLFLFNSSPIWALVFIAANTNLWSTRSELPTSLTSYLKPMPLLEKTPPEPPKAQMSPALQPGHTTPQRLPVMTLQDSEAPLVCCLISSSLSPTHLPPTSISTPLRSSQRNRLLSLLQTPGVPVPWSPAHVVPTQMPLLVLSGTSSHTTLPNPQAPMLMPVWSSCNTRSCKTRWYCASLPLRLHTSTHTLMPSGNLTVGS